MAAHHHLQGCAHQHRPRHGRVDHDARVARAGVSDEHVRGEALRHHEALDLLLPDLLEIPLHVRHEVGGAHVGPHREIEAAGGAGGVAQGHDQAVGDVETDGGVVDDAGQGLGLPEGPGAEIALAGGVDGHEVDHGRGGGAVGNPASGRASSLPAVVRGGDQEVLRRSRREGDARDAGVDDAARRDGGVDEVRLGVAQGVGSQAESLPLRLECQERQRSEAPADPGAESGIEGSSRGQFLPGDDRLHGRLLLRALPRLLLRAELFDDRELYWR